MHLLLWNALESMTATIILVIYLLIFPHIHLPRTVLKIYKQCLSFQALFGVLCVRKWMKNESFNANCRFFSELIRLSSSMTFWRKQKTKKLRVATCKGWTKMITVLAALRKHLNKQHKKHGQTMESCVSSFKVYKWSRTQNTWKVHICRFFDGRIRECVFHIILTRCVIYLVTRKSQLW